MAGFRAPQPLLGLSSDQSTQRGVGSMLAFWVGGVGRQWGPQAGVGMLVFWMGGARVPVSATAARQGSGGDGGIPWPVADHDADDVWDLVQILTFWRNLNP